MANRKLFFIKNGKSLKNPLTVFMSKAEHVPIEMVSSLFDNEPTTNASIMTRLRLGLDGITQLHKSMAIRMHPLHLWIGTSIGAFVLLAGVFVVTPWKLQPKQQDKYSIYASTPLTLRDMNYSVYTKDARSQKINAVFKEYKCPMEGLGEIFVYEADKYNIPYWLVAAISFQESSCGKRTPEPSGLESYNAWGWAVYGDNVHGFDNWVRGIETVSEYMSDRFYKRGVTELCEIMKTYTPPSKGSWCEGVNYYGQEIQNFTSSDIL